MSLGLWWAEDGALGATVASGRFGADMAVELVNGSVMLLVEIDLPDFAGRGGRGPSR